MVKLLPCDHEVTGSSPGNSLLQKCRERLRTIDPKWSDPSPDPAQAGATCTGLPFFSSLVLIAFRVLVTNFYTQQNYSRTSVPCIVYPVCTLLNILPTSQNSCLRFICLHTDVSIRYVDKSKTRILGWREYLIMLLSSFDLP